MSKACYIHPSGSDMPSHWVMPAGVFGLMDLIKRSGIRVIGLNYPMELSINPGFSLRKWLYSNPAEYYLVGIHWFVHSKGACDVIKVIKEVNPDGKLIVGGTTATLFPRRLMELIPEIDFIVCGDSEEPLPALLNALDSGMDYKIIPNLCYREGNRIIENEVRFALSDFSDIKFSSYDFLHNAENYPLYSYPGILFEERSYWLVNGRGCIYDCPACGGAREVNEAAYKRNGLLVRSVDSVIEDIECLKPRKLDVIKLTHDICSFGSSYYKEFLKKYNELEPKMILYNEFWQLPDCEFIESAIRSGLTGRLQTAVTAYSGDEALRRSYGKFFSNKELLEAIEMCIRGNFLVRLYFSRFIPEDSYNTLKATLRLIEEISKIALGSRFVEIYYEPILADPCSKITCINSRDEIFDEYINWNNNSRNKLYKKMTSALGAREKILDKKIVKILEELKG